MVFRPTTVSTTVGQCIRFESIKFDYSWRCWKLTYKGETLTTREWADRLHVSRYANSASVSGRAFPQSDFSWKTATRAMCPLRTSSDRVLSSHDWH